MSQAIEKKYTVLMSFPVDAVHKTTVWASSKDEAESSVQHLENDEWELVECNPNKIALDGFSSLEVEEDEA